MTNGQSVWHYHRLLLRRIKPTYSLYWWAGGSRFSCQRSVLMSFILHAPRGIEGLRRKCAIIRCNLSFLTCTHETAWSIISVVSVSVCVSVCQGITFESFGWWSGVVVSALALINEVNQRRARLVLRWATVSGFNSRCRTFISVCNQPATQGQLSRPSLRGR